MTAPAPPASGDTAETLRHRALGSATRATILRLVRECDSGLTAGQVALATGLHLTTVRAHLDRLAEADLLAKSPVSDGRPGRPAWRYRAGTAVTPYRDLAAALLGNLVEAGENPADAAERVGRRWGLCLAPAGVQPLAAVMTVLDQQGFAARPPDRHQDGEFVELHLSACPFLDLAKTSSGAMCGLHRGVVQGVLERTGSPGARVVLEPFKASGACLLRVSVPGGAGEP